MQQSDWQAARFVQESVRRLVEGAEAQVRQAARLVESLAMFSAADAQVAESEVRARLDIAFQEAGESLVRWVDKAIEDRINDQEDWDSSTNIHLLNRLRQDAEALTQGNAPRAPF